jgi:hypothetical protein
MYRGIVSCEGNGGKEINKERNEGIIITLNQSSVFLLNGNTY